MRFILILLISGFVFPQNNDTEAALYNVASNAIVGGIGAVINKKPNEKFHKVLLKGLGQGAIGGYINFESKKLVREFSKTGNYAYLWPSKLLNSAGSSITYNAASNRNFWERWHVIFGFNYLEYDFKREKKLRYRILPFALVGNIHGFATGKFDFKRSLYAGQFIFKNKNIKPTKNGIPTGQALFNTVQFDPSFGIDIKGTIAHELIHVHQYTGSFPVNAFMSKPVDRLQEKGAFFKTYHKIFFTEYNVLFGGISIGQDLFGVKYEDLFYEREARYYSFY